MPLPRQVSLLSIEISILLVRSNTPPSEWVFAKANTIRIYISTLWGPCVATSFYLESVLALSSAAAYTWHSNGYSLECHVILASF
jgi:hypothetical protein